MPPAALLALAALPTAPAPLCEFSTKVKRVLDEQFKSSKFWELVTVHLFGAFHQYHLDHKKPEQKRERYDKINFVFKMDISGLQGWQIRLQFFRAEDLDKPHFKRTLFFGFDCTELMKLASEGNFQDFATMVCIFF